MQELLLGYNSITDEACDVIAEILKYNTSLVRLKLVNNFNINGEAAQRLVQALKLNSTLKELQLPNRYPENVRKRIRSLQEEVNNNRQSRGCETKLNIEC